MVSHIHHTHRTGWLRAGVLGANDGILSLASLLLGVIAAGADLREIWLAGVAGLVAGIVSMAAGEYVSVSSQADTERADLNVEKHALRHEYDAEQAELRDIYIHRGLDAELAEAVASQLMAHDALDAHARDEIGISSALSARPLQAALSSCISFAIGGSAPLLVALVVQGDALAPILVAVSLGFLALLGAIAAYAGGASIKVGTLRVFVLGALAMLVGHVIGTLMGIVV